MKVVTFVKQISSIRKENSPVLKMSSKPLINVLDESHAVWQATYMSNEDMKEIVWEKRKRVVDQAHKIWKT